MLNPSELSPKDKHAVIKIKIHIDSIHRAILIVFVLLLNLGQHGFLFVQSTVKT